MVSANTAIMIQSTKGWLEILYTNSWNNQVASIPPNHHPTRKTPIFKKVVVRLAITSPATADPTSTIQPVHSGVLKGRMNAYKTTITVKMEVINTVRKTVIL